MIKKTALDEFRNLRKNGLIAIALKEDDELIGVRLSTGNDDMLLSTRKGMSIRFNERHVRNMGRNSMGVRSIRLAENDEVIDIAAVEPETTVLAVTTLGYGKRTDPEEYREQGRNGKGIRAMNLTEKTGDLAALLFVHEDEDILLITDDGTIIRARAKDIRLCGRATQGVRLINLTKKNDVIASVCKVMSSELEAYVTEESRAQWLKTNEQFQKETTGINENAADSSNDAEGNTPSENADAPLIDIDDDEAIEIIE
jgi:DNA gyrase subunit A